MERPRGKCAIHWLLDHATQLTNLKRETPCPEPPQTYEAALRTTALAAALLFAHGQTTERTVTAPERLGHTSRRDGEGATSLRHAYQLESTARPSHKSSPSSRSAAR